MHGVGERLRQLGDRDGLVYVCDRVNDRIQVFKKDGSFVKEFQVEPQTLQNGSVWDLVLSEDRAQRYIFVAASRSSSVPTELERRELGLANSVSRPRADKRAKSDGLLVG